MKTSQNGLEFVAREEGEVDHVYNDIAGIPTIGVGHVVRPGESFPNGITHQQAMDMLAVDIGTAENQVNTCVKVTMTQNQFDALVSFTFNCGGGALAQSSTLKDLNSGDIQGAANALLLWDKTTINGVLQSDPGLHGRRVRERQLFLTPDGQPLVKPAPVPTPPPTPTPPPLLPVVTPAPVVVAPAPATPVSNASAFQKFINLITMVLNALLKKRS